MAVNKYIVNSAGTLTEQVAPAISAGAADAGKLPALNSSGKLDSTFMPSGVGADTDAIAASEALSAGAYVNVWNNSGVFNVRNADATVVGKEAHGYVLAAFASSATATVYFEGTNTQVTGQTAGRVYLSTTPGIGSATAPSGSGNVVQVIGYAVAATQVNFQANNPFVLA